MEYLQQASDILGHVGIILGASYAIAVIVPGEQPDKFLEKCLTFTKKISRKKK